MPHFLNHGNAEFIPPCVEIHFAHISQSPLLLDSDSWGQRSLCPHSSSWNLGANCSPIFWLCQLHMLPLNPDPSSPELLWILTNYHLTTSVSKFFPASFVKEVTYHNTWKNNFFPFTFSSSGWAWDFKLLSPLIHPNSAVPQPHLRTGTLKPSFRLSKIKSHLR